MIWKKQKLTFVRWERWKFFINFFFVCLIQDKCLFGFYLEILCLDDTFFTGGLWRESLVWFYFYWFSKTNSKFEKCSNFFFFFENLFLNISIKYSLIFEKYWHEKISTKIWEIPRRAMTKNTNFFIWSLIFRKLFFKFEKIWMVSKIELLIIFAQKSLFDCIE
jgi:hypothetical protein